MLISEAPAGLGDGSDMPQVKYEINATFKVDGDVEKSDIVGALFKQTNEMLGERRGLSNEIVGFMKVDPQRHVDKESDKTVTSGTVTLPMYADSDTCTSIAASVEKIDNVGPFTSRFTVESIIDAETKMKGDIEKRSKEMQKKWLSKGTNKGR